MRAVAHGRPGVPCGGADAEDQWPQWRGPLANGVAPHGSPPVEWSETKNVRWKVEIPGEGFSTPIVWGDKIFLLSAVATGAKITPPAGTRKFSPAKVPPADEAPPIRRPLFRSPDWQSSSGKRSPSKAVPNEGRHRSHTYASASPVTDGERLYASFGSHGIFCFDMDGARVWERDLGDMETRYSWGEGASPVLADGKLIVNWDHEGPSFITALDKNTGRTIWKTERQEVSSWSTPLIARHAGQTEVVVPATERIRGYDLASGRELWNCGGLHVNVIAAPAMRNDTVYAMSGYGKSTAMAIRLGNDGRSHGRQGGGVASTIEAAPYVPSPLLYGEQPLLSCPVWTAC